MRASIDIAASWHHVRLAVRMLRREPAFSASAIVPLALGLGAAIALYSVGYAILLRPLPVADESSLVVLYASDPVRNDSPVSHPRLRAWQEDDVFDGLAAITSQSFDLVTDGLAERVPAVAVTGDFFRVLGVRAVHGRVLTRADVRLGQTPAVISYPLWTRRFAADPDVLGRVIIAGTYQLTIVASRRQDSNAGAERRTCGCQLSR